MTTFLNVLRIICLFLGIAALAGTIYLLYELIKTVKNANEVLDKGKVTVDLVDDSIKKVQVPLDSAVKISHTFDVAHDAALKGIDDAKVFINRNADVIKERLEEINRKQAELKEKEIKEPNPNDILKGE